MSYNPLNSPIEVFPNISTVIRNGTNSVSKRWYYNSADSLSTVQGSGYFTNGYELGMRVGDIVDVSVSQVLKTPTQYVSVADPVTGYVTIAAATT